MYRLLITCLLLWLALPGFASASRSVLYTGEPIAVRLALQQPTALTFPEPLTAVPTGADPATLSIELDGPRLFLQALRKDAEGILFAVGASGTLYPVQFQLKTPADVALEIVLPAKPPAPLPKHNVSTAGGAVRTLLVAILRGDTLPGATVMPHRHVVLDTQALQIVTTHVHIAGSYLGYLAVATNRTAQPLPLRLPEYSAPGLKAIAAAHETVPPNGSTPLYMVVQPSVPH